MPSYLRLVMEGLACWRLSSLLVNEDGPWRVFDRLRRNTGIEYTTQGKIFSWPDWNPLVCIWCTSLWAAPVIHWAPRWFIWLLALSALAITGERVNGSSKSSN
jgi:hypothetical protein